MEAKAEARAGIALRILKNIVIILNCEKAVGYSVDVGFPEMVRDIVLGGKD
jgi:hypothetical protein